MNREHAEALAKQVATLLRPACAEIAVVGSIRRSRPEVKDIELLCRPHAPRPVFGEQLSAVNPLEALVARLVRTGQLHRHPEPSKRKDGPKYKTLWLPEAGGIALDLFVADPSGENWGNLMAIRTGDFEFSQLLVTKASAGGLMPKGLLHHEGYLWRLGGVKVPCQTEADFFQALGIPEPPEPFSRTKALAARLRRSVVPGAKVAGVRR